MKFFLRLKGLSALADKFQWNKMSLKRLNEKIVWWFIRTGNYLLLTGRHICHYLIERIMTLQQIIDKKDTFSLI